MGCRGYNGVLLQLINKKGKFSIISQQGNSYVIYDTELLSKHLEELLVNTEEDDVFMQWYDYSLS